MLFNSYIFIFLFFPVCLLGYYMLKDRNATAAKVWLTGFSLWFYGYFNIRYLCIMIFSILLNYGAYQLMMRGDSDVSEKKSDSVDVSEKKSDDANVAVKTSTEDLDVSVKTSEDSSVLAGKKNRKKIVLFTGVSLNLLLLFYFKYFDFFIENINAVFGSSFALRGILLPLGISFFTFQQISFLTDAYRGELKNCSFLDYALFVSFFPQLIAGPIVTHDEMLPQFKEIGKKKFDEDTFCRGLFIFVLGMAKKVLIADTFGVAVDAGYAALGSVAVDAGYAAAGTPGSIDAILVMLFYTLQLYFDFSGYCDMAIGIGKMLGIEITLNFNSPYKACNIIDFWKRWHITLSRFFTKNIYIPLGGNRKGNVRMYANLFLVFFLSGLWHGAGWNYILWGVMHGVLYCITRWIQKNSAAKRNHAGKQSDVDKRNHAGDQNSTAKRNNAEQWNHADRAEKSSGAKQQSMGSRIGKTVVHVLKVLGTFLYVNVAWVFFRSPSIEQACLLLKRMVTGGIAVPMETIADAFNLDEFWYVMKVLHLTDFTYSRYILMVVFTLVILLATFFGKNVQEMAKKWKMSFVSGILLAIIFVWCIVSLSGVSTFLYFNF